MRHVAANALTILIVLGVALAAAILWAATEWRSAGPSGSATEIAIPRGATLNDAAEILAEAGVIDDARLFRLGARYEGLEARIQAGEFEMPAGISPADAARCIVDQSTCRRVTYSVTVVPGSTVHEVVEALRAQDVLTGEIAELPGEGTLAPDTYEVQRGDSRASVIARMETAQARILAEAWRSRDPEAPLESAEEALILASIIEKETGVAGERARIGGVFANRLEMGMRLQTDPTVIYEITRGRGALGRGLLRSELEAETPWNTYVISGLPPTPIANPGRAAIEAAVRPAETDSLYFVADGTGGHAFAETLTEHLRNVAVWRRIEAQRAD